jgi:hypothetical protein
MYVLVAGLRSRGFAGEVGRAEHATFAGAAAQMAHWARFGVDNLCTDPDEILIHDSASGRLWRWNWQTRAPEETAPLPAPDPDPGPG